MDAQAVLILEAWMKLLIGNVQHDIKVAACYSVPRLGFQDNATTAYDAFAPHGVKMHKGTGAFWDQTMSALLTEVSSVESGNDFLVTVDYDSVFEPECFTRLMSAMLVSGVDAIAPLQVKRNDKMLMFKPLEAELENAHSVPGVPHAHRVTLPTSWFDAPSQPVATAHFGLTIFRCSSLRKMPKPWFVGLPGKDGDWGDDRVDADINFWHMFRQAGFVIAICPQVAIGHAELVFTWPDQRLEGIYQYPCDYWADGGRPPEAWGSKDHGKKSEENK